MGRIGDPMVLLWAILWLGLLVVLVAGIVWALCPPTLKKQHSAQERTHRDRLK